MIRWHVVLHSGLVVNNRLLLINSKWIIQRLLWLIDWCSIATVVIGGRDVEIKRIERDVFVV
jgi:hypothetical protein